MIKRSLWRKKKKKKNFYKQEKKKRKMEEKLNVGMWKCEKLKRF